MGGLLNPQHHPTTTTGPPKILRFWQGGLSNFSPPRAKTPAPQDVNSVISLNLAIFLMTLKHNI